MDGAVLERGRASFAPECGVDVDPVGRRGTIGDTPPAWLFAVVVAVGATLRVWRALHNGLSFDESFTALAGRRPVGGLVGFLSTNDSHPPLDYLIRMPIARAGAGDLWLRAPSIVFSCAALGLFAWWMRERGWFGLLATALLSFSTLQVMHGGEARMYALLELLGVAVAVIAERWLRAPRPWQAWALAALVLVALFDHVSGLLLGLGLVVLAGLRVDRDAWRLRGSLAVAGALWGILWIPVILTQLPYRWSDWMPRTTPSGFARVVGEQFVSIDGTTWVALAAVVVGGVVLVRRDRVLGRLWLSLGVVAFAAAAAVGLGTAFFLPRTMVVVSWAPVVAVAAILDEVRRRFGLLGRAVAVLVPVLVLVATSSFLALKVWDYDLSIAELQRVARPGDVIAVRPARYGLLVDWRIGVRGDRPTAPAATTLPDAAATRVLGAPPSGRVWLLTGLESTTRSAGYERCAPPWDDGVTTVVCLMPRAP